MDVTLQLTLAGSRYEALSYAGNVPMIQGTDHDLFSVRFDRMVIDLGSGRMH